MILPGGLERQQWPVHTSPICCWTRAPWTCCLPSWQRCLVLVAMIFLVLRTPHIQICLLGASPSGCSSCQKPAWTLAAYHGYHKVLIKHLHGYHKVLHLFDLVKIWFGTKKVLRVFFDQLSEQEILRHLLITDQVLLLYLFLNKYSFSQFSNHFILIKSQMITSSSLMFGTDQDHGRRTVLHEVVTNRDKISTELLSRSLIFFLKNNWKPITVWHHQVVRRQSPRQGRDPNIDYEASLQVDFYSVVCQHAMIDWIKILNHHMYNVRTEVWFFEVKEVMWLKERLKDFWNCWFG